jgi:hypothetical protein
MAGQNPYFVEINHSSGNPEEITNDSDESCITIKGSESNSFSSIKISFVDPLSNADFIAIFNDTLKMVTQTAK